MQPNNQSHALTAIPFTRVRIEDTFWSPRIVVNRTATLPIEYEQLKSTGHIDALKLNWKQGDENEPHVFWESDTAKWVEAASYELSSHPDEKIETLLSEVVDLIVGAQQPDGYLNVHFTVVEPDKRLTNLRDQHELYCAGHLIEAAVAHAHATGSDKLLNVMRRYADYIGSVFGTGPGQKRGYCGHEEIELALIKLYRYTGEKRYLDLASYFVDERGQKPYYYEIEAQQRGEDPAAYWAHNYSYCQAEKPVRELDSVAGHAVRAMYLYSAMADLVKELGDDSLKSACERLWAHLCNANMYITGGIGSSRHNEGFTTNFDLPNETAYAETCAAIGLAFWSHRMLHIDNDSKYADVLETALYNGIISGVSLDGKKFFYENPLASNGSHHRQDSFGCWCCPPNVARILASLGEYIYSEGSDGIAVHLYIAGRATAKIGNTSVKIEQQTNYPWDGDVTIHLTPESSELFEVKLRIPAWCRNYTIKVNDEDAAYKINNGYAILKRNWASGDTIKLHLDMPVELIEANPAVVADRGKVAIRRGPTVYCLESTDNLDGVAHIAIRTDTEFTTRFDANLLGGVVVIEADGVLTSEKPWEETLYRAIEPHGKQIRLTAVPYSTWDNRGPGEMAVWLDKA